MIRIYTDGACSKDGRGGWAWAVEGDRLKERGQSLNYGFECPTTNQRMELTAALKALVTYQIYDVTIVSDSKYVVDCFNQKWYVNWRKNGWKNASQKPVANQDLWEQMLASAFAPGRIVAWEWVRGHDGNAMNDFVDQLAVQAKQEGISANE